MSPPAAGTKLGPYEILSPIGAGGMGEVWKARDTRLDRIIALKVSKTEFSQRFEREARAIAALNHPNICHLYDVGPNYLVMEYVDGALLKGPLPLAKAIELADQILDALDAAHRKGIVHRDLKPANILVTKTGLKVLDFGLAKMQNAQAATAIHDASTAVSVEGSIAGTLQYMAPEQLQGKSDVDTRADIFSFGCVLYEMLTGEKAFEGSNAASVIAAVMERPAPSVAEVAPAALDRVLQKCLAKDPDDRWQNVRDLKTALNWAVVEPSASRVTGSRRERWIAAVAAALALAGISVWATSRLARKTEIPVLRLEMVPPQGSQFVSGSLGNGGIDLSPDGKTAAFIASTNGKAALWIRALDGGEARPLPGTDGAFDPFWSRDGKTIAFFAAGKLYRVSVASGSPLIVCDAPSIGVGGAWDEDGQIVFGSLAAGLYRVAPSGGNPSSLTTPDRSRGEITHRYPHVLPRGRLLYFARSNMPEYTGIYVTSLSNPAQRKFLMKSAANALYAADPAGTSRLLWLRGSTLMAQDFNLDRMELTGYPQPVADPVASMGTLGELVASASQSGHLLYSATADLSQLTWFDRTGRPNGTVGDPGGHSYPFRVSPDGRRVVLSLDRPGGNDLWIFDLERRVSTRLTSKSPSNVYPVWSPDGRTVIFARDNHDLFRKSVEETTEETKVSDAPVGRFPTDWSHDGRFVMEQGACAGGQICLGILPATPDGVPRGPDYDPTGQRSPFDVRYGRFSPETDPHWIAFQSSETGRVEVYVQSFQASRSRTQISTEGGRYPEWGPGGRELFYVDLQNRLMAVDLDFTGNTVRPSLPHALFTLPIIENGWTPYDVSPDGQKFLVRAASRQGAEALKVIVNWPGLLRSEQSAR